VLWLIGHNLGLSAESPARSRLPDRGAQHLQEVGGASPLLRRVYYHEAGLKDHASDSAQRFGKVRALELL